MRHLLWEPEVNIIVNVKAASINVTRGPAMKRLAILIWFVFAVIVISGCAGTVQLGTIPRPPDTSRLRLAIIPLSGFHKAGGFYMNNDVFKAAQYQQTATHLEKLGYYEVVPEKDVSAVLGKYDVDLWALTRNSAELSRGIGEALFADYMLLIERSLMSSDVTFTYILVNTKSGNQFNIKFDRNVQRGDFKTFNEATEYAYTRIFMDAKGDLLSTAMNKGRSTARQKELEESKAALDRQLALQRAAEEKVLAESKAALRAEAESKRAAELRKAAELEKREAETRAAAAAEKMRLAALKAEAERREADEIARLLREKEQKAKEESARRRSEDERRAAETMVRELAEKAALAAEKAAREKAEAERIAAEKATFERRAIEELARKKEAEQQRLAAREKASREAEQSRQAAQKAAQEKVGTEQLIAQMQTEEKANGVAPVPKVTTHISDSADRAESAEAMQNRSRLIVYDINAAEQLRTVALILSEAIRQEVFQRGAYELVNRENLKQIMEEMTFQQSGMVSDSQAVKIGQGMAAQEIMLGQLSPIGSSLVLQSKRVDMGSMSNLSLASIRCESGKEEVMLDRIKELIDTLFAKHDKRK